MKKLLAIIPLILALLVIACDDEKGFSIKCEIDGLDTHGLEMVYFTRSGVVKTSFHPVDGKVTLKGTSAEPTLVEVFTLDGKRLFSCVAVDGDRMKLKMNLSDPSSVTLTGRNDSRDYIAFTALNDSILTHGNDAQVNALIARTIRSNPSSMSSTLLMVTHFRAPGYELLADSLLGEIASEARPPLVVSHMASAIGEQVSTSARGSIKTFNLHNGRDTTGRDTLVRFSPAMQSYSMLIFSDAPKPDSIRKLLRKLTHDSPKRRLKIVEISLTPDSTAWRANIKADSANWLQAWSPGGASAKEIRRLAVPRTPYIIITDSTGTQIYRGTSSTLADTLLRRRINIMPVDTISDK